MVAMFQKILGRSADDIVELQQRADGGGGPCNPLCTLHKSVWQCGGDNHTVVVVGGEDSVEGFNYIF